MPPICPPRKSGNFKAAETDDAQSGNGSATGCCLPRVALSFLLDRKRKSLLQEEAEREAAKILDRQESIRKQKNDTCNYRYIQLENGLRILLVSKEDTSTSAAALNVKVGSFSDPINLQGLAHLCEHVLFTGSEAFPNESYSAFLGQRGGSSNACTASEHTNFHFDVSSQHFEEALARFVSFFECPLFKEASVQNELEIVQSEHEKNRWSDAWRTNQVERATANESHAFSRFSTGTRQTLTVADAPNRNLKYELFAFFRANYSANLMTLCLVHNQSLDLMEQLCKDLFLRIPNKNIPETIWPNRPFKPSQMKTKISVVPVKDIYHANLTFPMEDFHEYYQAAPEGFVAQLIGYKGPGGLFAHLKHLGYAHHLVASWRTLARGFSFFMVTVQMTETGERHVDEVVKHVFQYIQLLKTSGVQEWFFQEMHFLSEQQFEQKELERAQTYASNIAGWLHLYKPRDVLIGDYVIERFRPDVIRRVLGYLVPDNVRVTVLSKNCRYFADQVEPHFGSEFHVERIPEETLHAWRHCGTNPHHRLAQPNPLISRNLDVIQIDPQRHSSSSLPELFLLLERIRMRSWYKPATNLAKACVYFKFSCPQLSAKDARSCSLNSLLAFLVRDSLTEIAYCAELAGLFYTLRPTKFGLELNIRGFSEKQAFFLQTVLAGLYCSKFSKDRFQQVYEVHKKGLESSVADSLKSQAKYLLSSILCPSTFSRVQRLEALKTITFEELVEFADAFRVQSSVECFFYGNLTLSQADAMASVAIEERKMFLEAFAEGKKVTVRQNVHLEEWFLKNPIERIVLLEEALMKHVFNRKAQKKQPLENGVGSNGIDASVKEMHTDDNEHTEPEDAILPSMLFNQELVLPASNSSVFIVHNEVQSSSCVLFYLQFKEMLPENSAIMETFFNLTRVRLVSSMKHVVTLGYVVDCDVRKMNNNLGFRITVESQYPLKVVHDTIEKALEDLKTYLEEITPERLEMCKQALIADTAEAMWRLRDCADRLWREIQDSTYNFRRKQEELKQLEQINMSDIRKFYSDWIHRKGRERRKLVISIGPDPILNYLDDVECLNLALVPELQKQCSVFSALSSDELTQWCQAVFASQNNDYQAPE